MVGATWAPPRLGTYCSGNWDADWAGVTIKVSCAVDTVKSRVQTHVISAKVGRAYYQSHV